MGTHMLSKKAGDKRGQGVPQGSVCEPPLISLTMCDGEWGRTGDPGPAEVGETQ